MEKVLKVQNLVKKYKNGRGIMDISFDIYKGQVVGLVGPNGSGKTTIMKAITGLVGADNGTVEICGINIRENFEKAIKDIGCIIEKPSLLENMTCHKNLQLISNYYKDIDEGRTEEVLRITGLLKYKNDKVKTFSLGMKQRLAIAMAIYQKPKLIILDEPTNGLDIEGIKDLRMLISDMSKEFMISFLISSHQIYELEMLCDKLVIIKDGILVDTCDVCNNSTGLTMEEYFIKKVKNTL